MAKIMCPHCGSPNSDANAACYDCSKPLHQTKVTAEKVAEKATEETATVPHGKLPEDFPGFTALKSAGVTTYAKVRGVNELTDIQGIGAATAKKILEALSGEPSEREGEAGELS